MPAEPVRSSCAVRFMRLKLVSGRRSLIKARRAIKAPGGTLTGHLGHCARHPSRAQNADDLVPVLRSPLDGHVRQTGLEFIGQKAAQRLIRLAVPGWRLEPDHECVAAASAPAGAGRPRDDADCEFEAVRPAAQM